MCISMATAKEIAKQNRHLFQEMPFYGVNFTQSSNQFENLSTKKQLDCLTSIYDLDLVFNFNAPDDNSASNHSLVYMRLVRCKYYSPHSFDQLKNNSTLAINNARFSILHNNL